MIKITQSTYNIVLGLVLGAGQFHRSEPSVWVSRLSGNNAPASQDASLQEWTCPLHGRTSKLNLLFCFCSENISLVLASTTQLALIVRKHYCSTLYFYLPNNLNSSHLSHAYIQWIWKLSIHSTDMRSKRRHKGLSKLSPTSAGKVPLLLFYFY